MVNQYKTVVIVEDEPDTAEMFAEMMNLIGYEAYKSYGGISSIDLIAEKKPSAVLLDIMMPDLSGLEVMGYICRDPQLPRIPVIVVSARSLPSDKKRGLEAGATFYLTKPVTSLDLKWAIENAVQQTTG